MSENNTACTLKIILSLMVQLTTLYLLSKYNGIQIFLQCIFEFIMRNFIRFIHGRSHMMATKSPLIFMHKLIFLCILLKSAENKF